MSTTQEISKGLDYSNKVVDPDLKLSKQSSSNLPDQKLNSSRQKASEVKRTASFNTPQSNTDNAMPTNEEKVWNLQYVYTNPRVNGSGAPM